MCNRLYFILKVSQPFIHFKAGGQLIFQKYTDFYKTKVCSHIEKEKYISEKICEIVFYIN